MPHISRLRALGRDEQGGIAIMAAVFGMLLCALAALAVDLGSVVLTSRRIQGTADLAAMSAARDLSRAKVAAEATALANLSVITNITVQKGRYTADPSLTPDARFKVQPSEINAARVEVTAPAPLYFGRFITGSNHWLITRKATAALPEARPRAMFSIGSRLASVNEGVVNSMLSGLLGTDVKVSLASYNGLADVNVNLLQFSDRLATRLGVTAGDYDALLKHEATAGDILKVVDLVAGSNNSALKTITSVPLGTKVKLGDLIGVAAGAPGGLADHLDANVSALDLIMATLETANSKRQLELNLGLQAGLATVKAYVAIGERPNQSPWLTITDKGEPIISTTQSRIKLAVETASELKGLAKVKLPLVVELGGAEAKLSSLNCSGPGSAILDVKTGIAKLHLGNVSNSDLVDFKRPLSPTETELLSVLGGTIKITALAKVDLTDETWQPLNFSQTDVTQKTIKSVQSKEFLNSAISSLLKNTNAKVHIVGVNLFGNLLGDLTSLLSPLGPVLDNVVQPLLALLGVKLGEADVQMLAIDCSQSGLRPRLVT